MAIAGGMPSLRNIFYLNSTAWKNQTQKLLNYSVIHWLLNFKTNLLISIYNLKTTKGILQKLIKYFLRKQFYSIWHIKKTFNKIHVTYPFIQYKSQLQNKKVFQQIFNLILIFLIKQSLLWIQSRMRHCQQCNILLVSILYMLRFHPSSEVWDICHRFFRSWILYKPWILICLELADRQ